MNLYALLGVNRNATPDEVERAYRRLARRYHPGINPGDRDAEQMYEQIQQAYSVLGHPERRREYDRGALPVTDTSGVLIGIVTIDDMLDVAEASATREIQRIGGSEALDEPYMEIPFLKMIQKRAGWLTALFLGEMLTATAMGAFEHEISRAVVLALFVPLIISSGGNSGSQASTLVIRALALGEVRIGDWWRVMRREIFAGLALGSILGSVGFMRITLWSAFSDMYGPHWLLIAITEQRTREDIDRLAEVLGQAVAAVRRFRRPEEVTA